MRIRIKNEPTEMSGVLVAFDKFAVEHDLPTASTQKVKVALEELLNNILLYGFPEGGEHEIDISVERFDEHLTITVIDDGVPFDPLQKAISDETVSLEDHKIGGLGILLIRKLMDGVSYKRQGGCNIVILNKNLNT